MMVVAYAIARDVFNAEKPRLWSPARFTARLGPTQARSLDLHPDGIRFAVAGVGEPEKAGTHDHVALMFNFFDELRRIAPPAPK